VQLTFDADVEAFRAEFIGFLDEHLPGVIDSGDVLDRPRSSSTYRSGRAVGNGCCSTVGGCCPAIRRSSAAATPR